jgi:hypothetical protein
MCVSTSPAQCRTHVQTFDDGEAHTDASPHASPLDKLSDQWAQIALPSLPLPPAPSSNSDMIEVSVGEIITSTPPRIRRISATDTFTTADGSPLIPRRLTPVPSPQVRGEAFLNAAMPERMDSAVKRPVTAAPALARRVTAPEGAFGKAGIKVDPVIDDKKFREWVFPHGSTPEHLKRPSISRRHTVPAEDHIEEFRAGVALTLAQRVGDLRHMFPGNTFEEEDDPAFSMRVDETKASADGVIARVIMERNASRQSSVEFPLRKEAKTLAVVNHAAAQSSSLSPAVLPGINDAKRESQMGPLLEGLSRIEILLQPNRESTVGEVVIAAVRTELDRNREDIERCRTGQLHLLVYRKLTCRDSGLIC